MNTILIIGVIFFVAGIFTIIIKNVYMTALFMFISAWFLSVWVWESGEKGLFPRAIDVYRGNTTLQITYKDSVAVDSVVIFKEK